MSETTERLGRQIRQLRKRNDWTQERLAEAADLHVSYVNALEKGTKNASVDTLKKIAIAFNVSLPTLLSFDSDAQTVEGLEITNLMQEYTNKLLESIKKAR